MMIEDKILANYLQRILGERRNSANLFCLSGGIIVYVINY